MAREHLTTIRCTNPITGNRMSNGKLKAIPVRKALTHLDHTVNCGQCLGCRLRHSNGWAVRIMHEAQLHTHNCFLTLTYANEHLESPGLKKKTSRTSSSATAET